MGHSWARLYSTGTVAEPLRVPRVDPHQDHRWGLRYEVPNPTGRPFVQPRRIRRILEATLTSCLLALLLCFRQQN